MSVARASWNRACAAIECLHNAGELGEATVAKGPISTKPRKTLQGLAELSTRARRLSQRHRTVLLLVDGRRSVEQVRSLAGQAGAPPTCFDELVDMALIELPGVRAGATELERELDLDLSLAIDAAEGPPTVHGDDSVLPSSLSLHPESVLGDSMAGELPSGAAWQRLQAADEAGEAGAIEAAREILARALREQAPVAGSLTLMKLRRARSREDLIALLDEVEAKIYKPHRSLAVAQTITRARRVLDAGTTA